MRMITNAPRPMYMADLLGYELVASSSRVQKTWQCSNDAWLSSVADSERTIDDGVQRFLRSDTDSLIAAMAHVAGLDRGASDAAVATRFSAKRMPNTSMYRPQQSNARQHRDHASSSSADVEPVSHSTVGPIATCQRPTS